MKKNIFFTLIFTVLLAGWLGCNQNSPDETRTVDITFNSGDGYWEEGGEKVRTKVVKVPYGENGTELTPELPVYPHFRCTGWYIEGSEIAYRFTEPVTAPFSLYAKYDLTEGIHYVSFYLTDKRIIMEPIRHNEPAWKPKLKFSCKWYYDANFNKEFTFDTPVTEDLNLYGLAQDFSGTWAQFVSFLNSQNAAWYEDETVYRGFAIIDDTATSTAGIATEKITAKLKRFIWEKEKVHEEEYGNPVEQSLSILSKAKWKGAVVDMRRMSKLQTVSAATFRGFTPLARVFFPDTVTVIDDEAFLDCSNLVEMAIPQKLTRIGVRAFKNCGKIANGVVINEGATDVGEEAFRDCQTIPRFTIPSTLKVLKELAFAGCKSIKDINLPEGVVTLENGCFAYSGEKQSLHLPSTIGDRPNVGAFFFWQSGVVQDEKHRITYNGDKDYFNRYISPLQQKYYPPQEYAYDKNDLPFQLLIYYYEY